MQVNQLPVRSNNLLRVILATNPRKKQHKMKSKQIYLPPPAGPNLAPPAASTPCDNHFAHSRPETSQNKANATVWSIVLPPGPPQA